MRQEYSDLRGAYQKYTEEFLLLIVVVSEYYWQATNDHLKGMKNYASSCNISRNSSTKSTLIVPPSNTYLPVSKRR